jgi:predicted nucleotidyltransferase
MENNISDMWIERFVKESMPIIRKVLNPNLVIIFGSRVKGKSSEESDIDVIIVSDFFRGKPFLGRMPIMLRLLRFPWPIDFLCYSPDEFEIIKNNSIIIQEALKEGLKLV